MDKFITIYPNVSADIFGCNVEHFDRVIKGKDLRVIVEGPNHYIVRDDDYLTWYVPKDIAMVVERKEVPLV